MTSKALIERMQKAVKEDPDWLGSEAHLALVREYARERVPAATVVWLDEGQQTYSEGLKIFLGVPEADSAQQTCRLIAASLIHELSHMECTDASGRPAFDTARRELAGSKYWWDLSEQLFQWLEDARLEAREHIAHPDHDELVRENYTLAVRRLEDLYEVSAGGGELWTTEPPSAIRQLWFGLAERILIGDHGRAMAEIVAKVLRLADPIITAARNGEHTGSAREGALALTDLVIQNRRELTASAN